VSRNITFFNFISFMDFKNISKGYTWEEVNILIINTTANIVEGRNVRNKLFLTILAVVFMIKNISFNKIWYVCATWLLPRDGSLQIFQNRNKRDILNTTLLTRITAHK